MKTKYLVVALSVLLLVVPSQAQDKPKETKAVETPETIEFTKEQTVEFKQIQKDARTASLEAENLQLKIEAANKQLEDLKKAADAANKLVLDKVQEFTKLNSDQLRKYNSEEKDGKIILKKRKE